ERQARGSADLDLLPLVEDVLLDLLPVLVALRQHVLHEAVQVGLGGGPNWHTCANKNPQQDCGQSMAFHSFSPFRAGRYEGWQMYETNRRRIWLPERVFCLSP